MHLKNAAQRRIDPFVAGPLAVVALLYACLAFVYLPAGAYWSMSNGYKRIQADNIRWTPGLDLSITYPGQWLDPDFRFVPFSSNFYFILDGRVYFSQSPLIAALGKPFMALLGDRGGLLIPVLAGVLSVYLVAVLARRLGLGPPWAAILIAGLATPLVIYSPLFWEHSLAVALGLGAVVLVVGRPDAISYRNLVVSAVFAAMAAVVRKEMMFLGLMLGVVLAPRAGRGNWRDWREWRRWLLWAGVYAAIAMLYEAVVYFQTRNLITPEFRFGVPPEFSSASYLFTHGAGILVAFLFDESYGLLGYALVLAAAVYWVAGSGMRSRAREAIQVVALGVIVLGTWFFFWQIWRGGRIYGILGVSPWLVIGLTPRNKPGPNSRAIGELLLIVVGFFTLAMLALGLFTQMGTNPGAEWGSRYFLVVLPLGVPLALAALQALQEQEARSGLARVHLALSLALISTSVVLQALGLIQIRAVISRQLEIRAALLALPEKQIVTHTGGLASLIPDVYQDKEVYWAEQQSEFYEWIRLAYSHGVTRFAYVGPQLPAGDVTYLAPAEAHLSVVSSLTTAEGLSLMRFEIQPTASGSIATGAFALRAVADGLLHPDDLTYAPDRSGRLFVVEQSGRIRIVKDGQLLSEPFLDITALVGSKKTEQGLLGLAFDPAFERTGRLWVDYTNGGGDIVIARYTVSGDPNRADAASGQTVLQISHRAYPIHNGGQLAFGPDGYLYISVGDGDELRHQVGNAQNLNLLLGKILRIEVGGATEGYRIPPDNPFAGSAGALPEIFAYGLRNPWRFSFDRQTGDMYIGDVGESQFEEIDYLPRGSTGGANFGWPKYEGNHAYQGGSSAGMTPPIAEMSHAEGHCAIAGGYVYRGASLPDLVGTYIFGDYCSGQIWGLKRDGAGTWTLTPLLDTPFFISSFGEDQNGELYVLDHRGAVYQFAPAVSDR